MQSWRERCEKCVCLQGDYVEKWLHFQLPMVSTFFLNKLGDLRTWTHQVNRIWNRLIVRDTSFVMDEPAACVIRVLRKRLSEPQISFVFREKQKSFLEVAENREICVTVTVLVVLESVSEILPSVRFLPILLNYLSACDWPICGTNWNHIPIIYCITMHFTIWGMRSFKS